MFMHIYLLNMFLNMFWFLVDGDDAEEDEPDTPIGQFTH